MSRTQNDILARMLAVAENDFFGWRREVLLPALDHEHARPFISDSVTEKDWTKLQAEFRLEDDARSYLTFAIDKALNHRGISAERSVDKMTEYAWLMERDDVVAAMDAAEYKQYGVPKLKAFADGLGWPWPANDAELARMAEGLPCSPSCEGGCGL